MKYIIRILVSPFVLLLLIIALAKDVFIKMYLFLRYGGEWITYYSSNQKKTINDIYHELSKLREDLYGNDSDSERNW